MESYRFKKLEHTEIISFTNFEGRLRVFVFYADTLSDGLHRC